MFMHPSLFDELGPMKARQVPGAGPLYMSPEAGKKFTPGPEAGKKFISGPEAGRKYTPGPEAGRKVPAVCATRRRHHCLSPVRHPNVHAL